MQDLDEAIVLGREALGLLPQGHPQRSSSLNNLLVDLSTRYDRLGTRPDLDETILLGREALGLCLPGHPQRSAALNNLANSLSIRYLKGGAALDLDEAIVLMQEALGLRPIGHPLRSSSLHNLADLFFHRYKHLRTMEDLDKAIALGREALDLCPLGDPERSQSLGNLSRYLYVRFARSRKLEDKEELFGLYARLVHADQFVSPSDLSAAKAWTRMAEEFQHPNLLLAYETSLRLLTRYIATLPSLPQHLRILKDLTSSLAVDAFSACLRNGSVAHAVELLEQGRGVFWSQLTRLRSPLDGVIDSGSEGRALADKFTQLASSIHNVLKFPRADQHEQLFYLSVKMQSVVNDIRELPGLSRFLLPPLFSDLRHAACQGPVIIINASKYSCDALIVLLDQGPVHIPLQITQRDIRDLSTELRILTVRATEDMAKQLAFFLRKLWDQIVSPIVDFLRTVLPLQSRIWWCPTAEFSALPLHAAGPFRKGQKNLPALYISSFTPTLTALVRARRQDQSDSPTPHGKRFLAIGQDAAAGESELPSVGAELDIICQGLDGLATLTRVDGKGCCVSRVVEELGKNEWAHLACHGIPNRKRPFESAFALRDAHFTIQQIIGCELKNPEFAYLSACHTTAGDEESPDEVIYLASAMQFIGFRSVIGTMWAVDDGKTNEITSTFYKYMVDESGRLDYTRAALALNRTMRSVDVPFDQRVLYIHIGA